MLLLFVVCVTRNNETNATSKTQRCFLGEKSLQLNLEYTLIISSSFHSLELE